MNTYLTVVQGTNGLEDIYIISISVDLNSNIFTATIEVQKNRYTINWKRGSYVSEYAYDFAPIIEMVSSNKHLTTLHNSVWNYDTKQYDQILTDRELELLEWSKVKDKRQALLNASDWTQLPDVPTATKEAWTTYRQTLRDITQQPDPFNIIWPQQPQ